MEKVYLEFVVGLWCCKRDSFILRAKSVYLEYENTPT